MTKIEFGQVWNITCIGADDAVRTLIICRENILENIVEAAIMHFLLEHGGMIISIKNTTAALEF